MKVYGNLERAQFESLGSNPSAGVLGRFWWNTGDGKAYLDKSANNRPFLLNDDKAIIGNSVTAAENVRFHRGAAGVLQIVKGDDATAEGSMSANFNKLSFLFEGYTDAGKPSAGNAGRLIYLTDLKTFMGDDGSAWNSLGGGGSGGGSVWSDASPDAPTTDTENDEKVYLFGAGLAQSLHLFIKVPESYVPGKQIKAYIAQYSPSAANTQLLSGLTYLIRKDTDAIDSTTNSYASTNTALTNTVANQYRKVAVDLTNATGQINSITVQPGDIIKIKLSRGTDTDTADIRMIPNATEVKFS